MAIAASPRAAATAPKLQVTAEQVWRAIEKASFAVVGYVTPSGEARSSGVVYKAVGKHLYIAVAPASWKARHIAASKLVSVTIPVHRGGILALVAPIPPATISFHAQGIVHAAGSVRIESLSKELESLLPADRRDMAVVIELIPEGRFLTYGVGVSLMDMRKPELAEAVVPVTR
jgi:hypothetical protein